MKTPFCQLVGIDVPIVLAPMSGAVGAPLVAAVCNSGGLGTMALWSGKADSLRQSVAEIRSLTENPFAVNLNMGFPHNDHLEDCIDMEVPIVSLFWGLSTAAIARAKSAGLIVMQSVRSAAEARLAVDAGADVIVAQGWESGGHVWGTVGTMALVPAVVDAVGDVPVVAAGGIADGRGLAAALALGAQAAWIGTRFLASTEAQIHSAYQTRLLNATEDDTRYFEDLFDIGWRRAPYRVLKNSTVKNWTEAGHPPTGERPNEREILGVSASGKNIPRYASHTPGPRDNGDIEAMSMWAGQGVAQVNEVMHAADIMSEISADAAQILQRLKM